MEDIHVPSPLRADCADVQQGMEARYDVSGVVTEREQIPDARPVNEVDHMAQGVLHIPVPGVADLDERDLIMQRVDDALELPRPGVLYRVHHRVVPGADQADWLAVRDTELRQDSLTVLLPVRQVHVDAVCVLPHLKACLPSEDLIDAVVHHIVMLR